MRFRYRLVGTRVVEYNGVEFTGRYLGEIGWPEEQDLIDSYTVRREQPPAVLWAAGLGAGDRRGGTLRVRPAALERGWRSRCRRSSPWRTTTSRNSMRRRAEAARRDRHPINPNGRQRRRNHGPSDPPARLLAARFSRVSIASTTIGMARRRARHAVPLRAAFDPTELRELSAQHRRHRGRAAPLRFRYRLVGTRVVEFNKLDFTGSYLGTIGWDEEQQFVDACADVVPSKSAAVRLLQLDAENGNIGKCEFGALPVQP